MFVIQVLDGRKMTLYRSSRNKREWLHVGDHCRAIDLILKKGKIGETYNIGSGVEVDVETIADTILDVLGLDASYKAYVPDRPGHDRRYLLDSNKLRTQLGWRPEVSFEHGFKETVLWYTHNRAWWEPLLKRLDVDEEGWTQESSQTS